MSDEEKLQSSSKPVVVVTGASGFIASHTIKILLSQNKYHIIGTVRGDPTADKYKWITDLDTNGNLELFQADLLTPNSYDKCISRATYVLHLASPFFMNPKDPQKDMIDPALKGTENVLGSCLKNTKLLKSVVVTSSVASVTDEPTKELYTEDDWNEKSSLTRLPYYYSKVVAEKKAWDIYQSEKPVWNLCVANPAYVMGPELHPNPKFNTSNNYIFGCINGVFRAIIKLEIPFVDVRDVALAHIMIMENPKASGRHILCNETVTFREIVDELQSLCSKYDIKDGTPKMSCDCTCCYCCCWLMMCCQSDDNRDYVRNHLNNRVRFDNKKIKNLGFEFKYKYKTCFEDAVKWGLNTHCITKNQHNNETTPLLD